MFSKTWESGSPQEWGNGTLAPPETEAGWARPTLEQVAFVFRALRAHMTEGGTYRYLVYERLGFTPGSGAYWLLLMAGGLDIVNALSGAAMEEDDD